MISDIGPVNNDVQSAYVSYETVNDKNTDFLATVVVDNTKRPIYKFRQKLTKKRAVPGHNVHIREPFGNGFKIHEHEMQVIHNIINYMDSKSTLALGWPGNQKYLIDLGKKIDHVHPLCFIWTILIDAKLKAKVKSFRDDSAFALKWNGFLGYSPFHDKGLGRNLERYYNRRQPADYMHEFEAFYKTLNLKPHALNHFVQNKDWKGFASAVLEESSYNK